RQHGQAASSLLPSLVRANILPDLRTYFRNQFMPFVFDPIPTIAVPVSGTAQQYPVHRIYCVGKNYADHIREMGSDPAREEPCFFLKPNDAIVLDGRMPYPPGTGNLHYEGELVLALGRGGRNIPAAEAGDCIFGYALG